MGSDPDVYPQWHSSQAGRSGGNYAGFSDADVDRWLEVGRQEPDREARRNAYLHFQARWAEEQPALVLYHPIYTFAVARDVWGVAADPLPDSSWRLRSAVSWHRVVHPTGWQEARAVLVERAPRMPEWCCDWRLGVRLCKVSIRVPDRPRRRVGDLEGEGERAALTDRAVGRHAAAHRLDQLADDRQTEAGAAAGPVARVVAPIEALEDAAELLRRDAGAGVLDGHCEPGRPRRAARNETRPPSAV